MPQWSKFYIHAYMFSFSFLHHSNWDTLFIKPFDSYIYLTDSYIHIHCILCHLLKIRLHFNLNAQLGMCFFLQLYFQNIIIFVQHSTQFSTHRTKWDKTQRFQIATLESLYKTINNVMHSTQVQKWCKINSHSTKTNHTTNANTIQYHTQQQWQVPQSSLKNVNIL